MKKTLHNILPTLAVMLLSCTVSVSYAQDVQKTNDNIEMEANAISVSVSGTTLIIRNAEQKIVEVFDMTGKKIYTGRIEGQTAKIDVDDMQRGVYIVKIGNVTRKVYIK